MYEYWIDPFELYYYYSINAIQRYVYNYYDDNRRYDPSTFERNMKKVVTNYGNTIRTKGVQIVRKEAEKVMEYVDEYSPMIYDVELERDLVYHIEYIWRTLGHNPCEICKSYDGKNITTVNLNKAHWNCMCALEIHEWYEDEDGGIYYENTRIL